MRRIETNRYYGSHLKEPRGIGSWAFSYKKGGETKIEFIHQVNYGVAKKMFLQFMKEQNISTAYVES